AVGMLFDCSFTRENGSSGNGNCSVWISETVSRPSTLHAKQKPSSILCRAGRSHVLYCAVIAPCGIRPAALHIYVIKALLFRRFAGDDEPRHGRQKQDHDTLPRPTPPLRNPRQPTLPPV